ncbi:response regulator [Mucilaginibacter sp. Mucisp86]|uniref:response regulator n=1 Tax=Mucilaginibacter sp. Mucisp86 TaxID=3243060 RepID=UPI0039B37A0B
MNKALNETLKKILILEDNQDILEILSEWFTTAGYEVAAYDTVTDIIALTEAHQPDLVLLDYLLGGINGGEYCAQLKKHRTTGHIPVIMLSAHQRVIDSLGHYGWDAFVAKPFDLECLTKQIDSLISQQVK